MQTHHLDVFADYFQFYVSDSEYETDTGLIWDAVSSDRMLALGDDLIAVGTARNMDVRVVLELSDEEPGSDVDAWDQVIECSLNISTGTVVLFGCTEDPSDGLQLPVSPGSYRARVSYGGMENVYEHDEEGDDHYRIQLWPGPARDIVVLKRRPWAKLAEG